MAELPLVQAFRTQVQNAPSAATPQVSFGQMQPEIEYKAQAQYQGAMADVLDRMSRTVFGVATEMSQRAGLQFAAENPLTAEQLQAMAKGDMSQVSLGSPLNVFNSAVRKARALEVSAHAEIEGRAELSTLLQKVETGELSTDQVRDQMSAMINGYGSSVAKIDPDAAYKYRATMAAVGGRVLEKTAELEGRKRVLANTVKIQRLYETVQKEISLISTTKMPIDPVTGKERPVTELIDQLKENFVTNAEALIGPTAAKEYVDRLGKDSRDAVVNAVASYISTDPSFIGNPNAINRLLRGDAGSASNAYQSLSLEDRIRVRTEFLTADAARYTMQQRGQENRNKSLKIEQQKLKLAWYYETDPVKKGQLEQQYLFHPATTIAQIDDMFKDQKSSPVGEAKIDSEIRNGILQTEESIYARAQELGVVNDGLRKVLNLYNNFYSVIDGTYADKQLRVAAKIPPDVINLDPQGTYAKQYNLFREEFIRLRQQAIKNGENFNAYETLDKIVKRAEDNRNSNEQKQVKMRLDDDARKAGLNELTPTNFGAFEHRVNNGDFKSAGLTKDDLPRIKRMMEQYYGGTQ